ncbi:MAG: DUF2283 domain-containing protein [Patescibacteria group bacterium]
MEITYDKEADAINISLRSGKVSKTIEVAPEIIVDVDKNGKTLSIEIIGASEKVGQKKFKGVRIGKQIINFPVMA